MRDVSYCLQRMSQTPLGLPCKGRVRDCSPETPLRDISFHVSQPPVIARRNSCATSRDKCRHLTPEDTGRAGRDPGTPARRNHRQQLRLLGMSSRLSLQPPQSRTYSSSLFICANIYLQVFCLFACLFSAGLPLLFLYKSRTSHTFYCVLWTSPLAGCWERQAVINTTATLAPVSH